MGGFCYVVQVLLTNFSSLPPLFEKTPNAAQELTIASKFLCFVYLVLYELLWLVSL